MHMYNVYEVWAKIQHCMRGKKHNHSVPLYLPSRCHIVQCYINASMYSISYPKFQTLLSLYLLTPISYPLNHEVATVCEIEKPLLRYWSAAAMMTIGKVDPSEVVIERKELFNRSLPRSILKKSTPNALRWDYQVLTAWDQRILFGVIVIYRQISDK